jgi:3-isopropylmalate/(R)-2-methylmalate dehydratase small subunit
MEPVRIVAGRALPLDRADVDTDQIIPAEFLKRIERSGFGQFLFAEWRKDPDFVLNDDRYVGASILVAGPNFGSGSSREHAPWALEDAGFRAIIAPSFADIFRTNCTKIGLLPVTLPGDEVADLIHLATARPGAAAAVDLELQVVETSEGREVPFAIEPGIRERLLNGWDDIALSLAHEEEIARYEREAERDGPVTTRFA